MVVLRTGIEGAEGMGASRPPFPALPFPPAPGGQQASGKPVGSQHSAHLGQVPVPSRTSFLLGQGGVRTLTLSLSQSQ